MNIILGHLIIVERDWIIIVVIVVIIASTSGSFPRVIKYL